MSDKYTYADVIIDSNDPRVEIGKEYYYCDNPSTCLERANKKDVAHLAVLEKVYPDAIGHFFIDDACSICIIRKKESEKKYVPFDLSKEEDRNLLKDRWIKTDGDEEKITGFERDDDGAWNIKVSAEFLLPEDMLNLWTFDDETPCGRLAEGE